MVQSVEVVTGTAGAVWPLCFPLHRRREQTWRLSTILCSAIRSLLAGKHSHASDNLSTEPHLLAPSNSFGGTLSSTTLRLVDTGSEGTYRTIPMQLLRWYLWLIVQHFSILMEAGWWSCMVMPLSLLFIFILSSVFFSKFSCKFRREQTHSRLQTTSSRPGPNGHALLQKPQACHC